MYRRHTDFGIMGDKNLLNLSANQETLNKQLPKNLIFNITYFVVNVLIGIMVVPYFIDTLGVAGYALIPLATSITGYVNLVILSLNTSVSRYLTIELQKENFKSASIIFNTSLFGTIGFSLLLIPIIIALSYYSSVFFDVPVSQKQETMLLFSGVMGSFLVRTWSGIYGVSLFAYNRLDLQNIVNIINLVIQICLIVILFTAFSPKLSYIGFSYLVAALISFIVTVIFSRKISPHLNVNIQKFELSQLGKLTKIGGWMLIDQLGTLLLFQIDVIVVNKMFGTVAGGEYSTILMWSLLVKAIAGVLSSILTPIVFTYYAKEMYAEIIFISKSAVKFMGLAIALPIGIICGFAPGLLSLWLGPEFSKLSLLMWILLSPLAINMSILPLFSINVAFGRVRTPALIAVLTGIGNLLLAIIIPLITDLGYYGVAIAGAIALTMRYLIFVPYYATKILNVPKNTFSYSIFPGFLSTLIVTGVTSIIYYYFNISSLIGILIFSFIISFLYISLSWIIFLNQSERKMIESFIPAKIRNQLRVETFSN